MQIFLGPVVTLLYKCALRRIQAHTKWCLYQVILVYNSRRPEASKNVYQLGTGRNSEHSGIVVVYQEIRMLPKDLEKIPKMREVRTASFCPLAFFFPWSWGAVQPRW